MDSHHPAGYTISTDPTRLQLDVIHGFLRTSYWAAGIAREMVERAIRHSLCFGLYHDPTGAQVGLARVVTDRATFGYLCDVFVLESHRRRGLARWLIQVILAHPELQGFRRWMLATRDAHPLYAGAGFTPLGRPDQLMELVLRRPTGPDAVR